jgi:fructoselysine-6-P-deglycase FrlB-like protein
VIQKTLIKFALAFFIIFTVTACFDEMEGQQAVDAFLKEMSPELARKIDKIGKEISLTKEKIDALSELKRQHPKYAGKIETARRQWKILQNQLRQSLKKIRDVVEGSYVTYKINKIQGGNQFNRISGELLSSADSVLASASTTKNAIEEALNEAVSEPLPSLDNVSNNFSDISEEPVRGNTFETEKAVEIVEPPTEEAVEITEEPATENNSLSPNFSCDAKTSLANARFYLMMMVISTNQAEQDTLKAEVDKASTELERSLAMLNQTNDKIITLQETWAAFKNTHETEILPAVRSGDNEKASEIANGIQAERMKMMNGIFQDINGDNCD